MTQDDRTEGRMAALNAPDQLENRVLAERGL